MKKLFIFFSNSGNGDLVKDKLEGFEIRKVEIKKPLPKSFFWLVFSGGFSAGMRVKRKLKEFDNDIGDYDEVVIGSPIWNGRFSTPINTVLQEVDLTRKAVKFVLWSGSGEAKGAVKRINKEYPGSTIIILKEPKKYNEELDKLKEL